MVNKNKKKEGRVSIGMILFGLIFVAVGVAVVVGLMLPMLRDGWHAQTWPQVQATLLATDLEQHYSDNSYTYEVTARYRYRYDGQDYEGTRVGLTVGSDNIGDWHQRIHRRLQRALSNSDSITVYVNPDDPADAVINRDIRWGYLGLLSLFPLVFGGVGAGIATAAFNRRQPLPTDSDIPQRPVSPVKIDSGGKAGMWGSWFFALIWNGISAPLFFAIPEEFAKGNKLILIGGLFPLIGIGILIYAVRATMEYRRFGKIELAMDPYPGAIGGEMAGTLDIPVKLSRQDHYTATLSCIHVYTTGSGKNRSTKHKVVWQESGTPAAFATGTGTRLVVRFQVPEGLPDSAPASSDYHMWKLTVRGEIPGVDLNRSFEIPMEVGTTTSGTLGKHTLTVENGPPPEIPSSLLRMTSTPHGTLMIYPMARMKGAAFATVLFGSIFLAVAYFAGQHIDGMGWLFSGVFGVVGLAVLLWGLWMPFNSLKVVASPQGVMIQRRWLNIPLFSRRMARDVITDIERVQGMQSQVGNKTIIYYQIQARGRDGRTLTLGENIPDNLMADRILRKIKEATGVSIKTTSLHVDTAPAAESKLS